MTKKQKKTNYKQVLSISWKSLKYSYEANPKLTTAHLILNTLSSFTPLVFAYITSVLIDRIIWTISNSGSLRPVYTIIAAIVLLAILSSVVNNLKNVLSQKFSLFLDFHIDKAMLHKISHMDLAVFEDPQTSNNISKISRNAGRLIRLVDNAVYILPQVVMLGTTLIILGKLSPLMLLLLFISTSPLFFEELFYGKRIWGIWDANLETVRDYSDTSMYVRSDKSISEVKTFGLVDHLVRRAINTYQTFIDQQMEAESKRLKSGIGMSIIGSLGIGASFFVIGSLALAGKITIGSIAFYIQTARSFAENLGYTLSGIAAVIDHAAYAEEFFEIMAHENKIISGEKKLTQSLNAPIIEFKNVEFKYPNTSKKIFDNFSLTIEPGQNIAIVGKNGAGKTTLIKLLLRLYDVDAGEITINKIPIKELDIDDLYSHIATLFQEFNMYHYNAKSNIGFGRIDKLENLDEIYKAAKMSGAHEFIEKFDKGYEQPLSMRYEGGVEPSYGQWQKIALARAFFRNPDILILDEPTSAIDPKAEFEIFETLFDFAQNKSVIIISHRFSTVRNAERIIVLENGKIIEDGSHSELMRIENGVYKQAFEIQRKGYE